MNCALTVGFLPNEQSGLNQGCNMIFRTTVVKTNVALFYEERLMIKGILFGIATFLFVTQTWADDVSVSGVWARATAPGQNSAAVSLHITSQKDARLVSASSSASASAELHTMKHDNGMMMMRQVDAISLPA